MGCGAGEGSEAAGGDNKEAKGASAGASRDDDKKTAKEENKGYQQTMSFLKQVQLFKRLPPDQHPLLAASCTPTDFKPGQVVIKQGDSGDSFFVIKTGEASVKVAQGSEAPTKVATLKNGDYFGENALLRDEPRTATITAESALSTFKITRDKFRELGLNDKLQFANRKAVGGGGKTKLETKPPSPKNDQERALIGDALQKNENLQTMVTLDEGRIKAMVDIAWKEQVSAGKEIIVEGDLQADYFYVVQEGSFEIYVSTDEESAQQTAQSAEKALTRGESKYVSTVSKGGSFGELALLYLVPRAATVKAKQASTVWVIDRMNFKNILMKVSEEKIGEYVKYLDRVEILEPLLADEKKAVAQALIEMHFAKNEVILQQGEPGNTFYILYDGEVAVIKDGAEQTRLAAGKRAGGEAKFFGERALLSNDVRAATVSVASETAKALALDRDSFNMLLGPLEDIIKRSAEGAASKVGKGQGPASGQQTKAE